MRIQMQSAQSSQMQSLKSALMKWLNRVCRHDKHARLMRACGKIAKKYKVYGGEITVLSHLLYHSAGEKFGIDEGWRLDFTRDGSIGVIPQESAVMPKGATQETWRHAGRVLKEFTGIAKQLSQEQQQGSLNLSDYFDEHFAKLAKLLR